MNRKQKYVLTFSQKTADTPITYHLIKDHDLCVNIINADITAQKNSKLLIEISGNKFNPESGIHYLTQKNVLREPFQKQLHFKEEECIACGACTGVCCSGALSINTKDAKIAFVHEKCTVCGQCIKTCPLQLLSIN